MRVAIVVLNLDIGGTQRVAVDLANAFYDDSHETHIIIFGNKKISLEPNPEVKIHRFFMQKSLKKSIIAIPFIILAKIINIFIRKSFFIFNGLMMALLFKYKLNKLEKGFGVFDLIIFRGNSSYELIWPLTDKRILQAIDNMDIKETKSLYEKVHSYLTLSHKNIVPISKEIESKVKELVRTNKISLNSLHTIYGPLNSKNIIKLSKEYKPDINSKYIVSIGRLAKVKNYVLLIDAYKYAYTHLNLRQKLVIVGDGKTRKDLESKIQEYELQEQVLLLGSLSNPYPWLIHTELFVTTSLSEGLGMTVLEALACKVKVVSTKSKGGVKEIMKDELREYMVDFSDENIATKIVSTLEEEKDWNFMKYTEEFSPKNIVNQYEKFYYKKKNQ